ncbi:MAG: S-methyl-5-thioribose-1-phosphate isomerase [Rickettsiales bacterium]|nr:S-methyl-5-thioribose-1-phosphate isomerase [Rickettsiales bacterium]|tara:strand:+ start:538 stop:1611 length:1074 start_codon:yes stop_codon:yes gene_type:complete
MLVDGKICKTIWCKNKKVFIIDQTKLPFIFKTICLHTLEDFCNSISNMKVRGAPLIGVTAAFGMANSMLNDQSDYNIKYSYEKLLSTRPTAVNLIWSLNIMRSELLKTQKDLRIKNAFKIAEKISKNDENACEKIGEYGCEILKDIFRKKQKIVNILTHCNAGWLAAVDWGTALAPIFKAKRKKIPIHVWVDETRPRNQGALLTAWELEKEKIPYTIIVDNAGGHLMKKKAVDICIVGSDRTALNGDVCNKIGTYLKALAAHDNSIPFYVALPSSTIDKNLKEGLGKIKIEERSGKELSFVNSFDGKKIKDTEIYFKNANVYNPAFDVTPAAYISGLITEFGICKANKIEIAKKLKI